MILDRHGREWYGFNRVTATDPPLDTWEASFDEGATWVADTPLGDWSLWLVAGPEAAVGTAVAVITRSMTPLVRAPDNPEIIVRDGPRIHLQ